MDDQEAKEKGQKKKKSIAFFFTLKPKVSEKVRGQVC